MRKGRNSTFGSSREDPHLALPSGPGLFTRGIGQNLGNGNIFNPYSLAGNSPWIRVLVRQFLKVFGNFEYFGLVFELPGI